MRCQTVTEGLLKKQIRDLHTVKLCDGSDLTSGFTIRELEIIAEAKKDFPKRESPLFMGLSYQQQMENDSLYIGRVEMWKKKWFGDST